MPARPETAPEPRWLARRLLAWHARHGRHDLPWQKNRTLYRVWVAEIMLQQTQVATVIPYYRRFLRAFPSLRRLADASLDAVLEQWTGLGYYARARNLHRAARRVRDELGGRLPRDLDGLMKLPGIGRSTAGAILAQVLDRPHPILDGNVKRVLARCFAVDGWPGEPAVEARLWELSTACTPATRCADYTQAIMDLGATVCTSRNPACGRCPLAPRCLARASGEPTAWPAPRPGRTRPRRRHTLLVLRDARGRVLLQRRPPAGIWGGLWTLPLCPDRADPARWCRDELALAIRPGRRGPLIRHELTHFRLELEPLYAELAPNRGGTREGPELRWHVPGSRPPGGLPAPVRRLLDTLTA